MRLGEEPRYDVNWGGALTTLPCAGIAVAPQTSSRFNDDDDDCGPNPDGAPASILDGDRGGGVSLCDGDASLWPSLVQQVWRNLSGREPRER